jgi:hypothetical protein
MKQRLNATLTIAVLALTTLLILTVLPRAGTAAPHLEARLNAFSCDDVTEIPKAECEALVALYNSTNGANWSNNSGWLDTNTPCNWYGVTCSAGHVTRLDLSDNQLSGNIPPELGNLANLQDLRLHSNQLSGSIIPPQLGNLANLELLQLCCSQLTGSIPPELGNLANLLYLYLGWNQLSGSIPPELGSLTNLQDLSLDHNQLSGSIPPELGDLANLHCLLLNINQFNGALPGTLTNLTNLFQFWFHDTDLCEPADAAFQTWLASISDLKSTGVICDITPPTCAIELREQGTTSQIDEVDVGQFFDIYVGDSTDDIGIREVRFSSDDSQDGTPTGEWTEEWYEWNSSSGDWNAETKVKKWSFVTGGKKELWAEIKDGGGNVSRCYDNIFVHPGYAIIVSGSGLWQRTFDHCANNAYKVLRNLGFNDDRIFYLNCRAQNIDGDPDNEVHAPASLDHFENVLNKIRTETGNNPNLLIIYLVGHGVQDAFLFDGGDLPVSILRDELDKFSSETRMVIVINSCYSGSFITPTYPEQSISAANRILITTTHNDQERRAFVWVRSSDRFWGALNKGINVRDAFTYRATAGDNWHMWLDDNGNREGHPPNNLEDDGELAATTKIGMPGTENLELIPWQYIWLRSPAELRVYDSQNRVTGLVNGEVKKEIPDSMYDENNEIAAIFSPSDTYRYQVVGIDKGTYGLDTASIEGGEATTFTAIDIPTSANATHQYTVDWHTLSEGEEGVRIQVDSDDDGEFEYDFMADGELTRDEFLAGITTPIPVGGVIVPVSEFELLGPWIILVTLAAVGAIGTVLLRRCVA